MTRQRVPNQELYRDTARQNLLTNGGFEIWQRGNGPFTGSVFGSDRWQQGPAGTDTLSVSRDSGNVDTSSKYSAACTFTLGTGAGNTSIYQTNEDLWELRGRTISFSVRVRTSTANAVRIGFSDGSVTQSAFHSGSGAFETLTVTRSVPVGAAYVLTLIYFAASCTAYIDNAMLVIGNVAADYAPLHPADDLARCLRYYEVLGGVSAALIRQWVAVAGAGADTVWTPFKVQKAVSPTVTKNGTWGVGNGASQPSTGGANPQGFYLTSGAAAAGNPYYQCADATTNVTAESNP